jgi:hypothetical protein
MIYISTSSQALRGALLLAHPHPTISSACIVFFRFFDNFFLNFFFTHLELENRLLTERTRGGIRSKMHSDVAHRLSPDLHTLVA